MNEKEKEEDLLREEEDHDISFFSKVIRFKEKGIFLL